MALRTLGWQARWSGDLEGAMSNCLSAETFLPEAEFFEARASIYSTLGLVHFSRNRLDLANCAVDRGFWLLRDVPDTTVAEVMTDLLLARATIQRHSGEKARSGITLGRARELSQGEQRNTVDYCTAIWLMADGDAEEAHKRANESLTAASSLGNNIILPYLHCLLGACEARMARVDTAEEHFKLGLVMAEKDDDLRAQSYLLREYAQMHAECGNHVEALRLLGEAGSHAKNTGFAFERKRVALQLAKLFEETGDYKLAVEQHKLAWRLQSETRVR